MQFLNTVTLIGVLVGAYALAQTPSTVPAAWPMEITATSAGVNGSGEKVEFVINKWSTDKERDQLSAAWSVGGTEAGAAARDAEGRGAEGGGTPAADTAGARGAANAGRGGRGGRGGGGAAAPAVPRTPQSALANAMKELPDQGYFWTSEVGGYLIRYAYKTSLSSGGTRITLLTDKRLGTAKNKWQLPAPASPNNYEFALIELRLPPKGEGEGKVSLTGSLTVDPSTRSLTLEGYDALPVLLKGVKVR